MSLDALKKAGIRPKPPAYPGPQPKQEQINIALGDDVMNPIQVIAARTGRPPGEILNELLRHALNLAVGFSKLGALGAALTTVREIPTPARQVEDPGDADTRTPEERLAALRDLAKSKMECTAVSHFFKNGRACQCGRFTPEDTAGGR
jgi:hypothetical protein